MYNIGMNLTIVPPLHVTILNLKSKANRNSDVNWLADLKARVSAETLGAQWVGRG